MGNKDWAACQGSAVELLNSPCRFLGCAEANKAEAPALMRDIVTAYKNTRNGSAATEVLLQGFFIDAQVEVFNVRVTALKRNNASATTELGWETDITLFELAPQQFEASGPSHGLPNIELMPINFSVVHFINSLKVRKSYEVEGEKKNKICLTCWACSLLLKFKNPKPRDCLVAGSRARQVEVIVPKRSKTDFNRSSSHDLSNPFT